MLPVFVRQAKKEDRKKYCEWALATENNGLDPTVLTYPSTVIKVAFNKDGPLVFLPLQKPIHMESLAVKPGSSESEVAAALMVLLQDVVSDAMREGVGEIWFEGTEPTVPKLAKRRGFEVVPYTVYRLRIADLEKKND
jgi:hypothetical protein